MSIRRYIPEKDAFIVKDLHDGEINTGLDELLEIGNISEGLDRYEARSLVGTGKKLFTKLKSLVSEADETKVFLHLHISEAHNLPSELTVSVSRFTSDWTWEEGNGQFRVKEGDGVTWKHRDNLHVWSEPGVGYGETTCTQTFTKDSDKDLHIDISELVLEAVASNQDDLNLLIGIKGIDAENPVNISYYSTDTHTIYRPYIEICWKDQENSDCVTYVRDINTVKVSVPGMKDKYRTGNKECVTRFNVAVRDLYPDRVYSTKTLYSANKVLPQSSCWGIKNEFTKEMVVDFSDEYTAISSSKDGNYFTVDLNMLEPEIYYRLLIKTVDMNGFENILDCGTFKVI